MIDPDSPRCGDRACAVRLDCPLYVDPASRERRMLRFSLRLNWEARLGPCLARQKLEGTGLYDPDDPGALQP